MLYLPMKTDGHYRRPSNDPVQTFPHQRSAVLLLTSFLACADNSTQPELTEEYVARIVAEELAKMADVALAKAINEMLPLFLEFTIIGEQSCSRCECHHLNAWGE